MTLLTRKHPNKDFFVADIFDGTPLKDDTASMEHPFFTLSQKPDMRLLEYRNGATTVEVIPSILGLPTIMDKDVLIYCASLLMQEQNAGREPPRRIRFSAHDYFKATNRADNKISYKLLENGLKRLSGCRVHTSLKTNRTKVVSNFGLIERYDYIKSHYVKDRLVRYEILLSEWYYNAILGKDMLTINEDYFLLKKGFERRLYEIARKHCGRQDSFKIRLENLHEKTGSTGALKKFRFNLKQSIEDNDIPDYKYSLDDNDLVTIKNANKRVLSPSERFAGGKLALEVMSAIKPATIATAKKMHAKSYTDWEYDEICQQFVQHFIKKGETLDTVDGTFVGFVKHKIKTYRKDYA
jgi:hypothetical protein